MVLTSICSEGWAAAYSAHAAANSSGVKARRRCVGALRGRLWLQKAAADLQERHGVWIFVALLPPGEWQRTVAALSQTVVGQVAGAPELPPEVRVVEPEWVERQV